jgi:hypothetical protein
MISFRRRVLGPKAWFYSADLSGQNLPGRDQRARPIARNSVIGWLWAAD